MANYVPKEVSNMNTPLELYVPTDKRVKGVLKKEYKNDIMFFGSFKTYGGTVKDVNGVTVIEDTADIVCWYHPNIKSNCRIRNLNDNTDYEIMGRPENINQQNQFLKFKVRAVVGGA